MEKTSKSARFSHYFLYFFVFCIINLGQCTVLYLGILGREQEGKKMKKGRALLDALYERLGKNIEGVVESG